MGVDLRKPSICPGVVFGRGVVVGDVVVAMGGVAAGRRTIGKEGEFCIDNLLVRIHSIIEMVLEDRPCAMSV